MTSQNGAFIISIDYECAWGYADTALSEADLDRIRGERDITIRLLELFERYGIPATWAIVGKLLEDGNDLAWSDPEGLVARIAASSARHEIGSHSYAHIAYGSSSEADAKRDIESAKRIHAANGLAFDSFVFPRNKEGHHDVVRQSGISCYRGSSPTWYRWMPYRLWTLGRGIDYWLPTARTIRASVHRSGLVNVPDSLLFVSRKGPQSLLPPKQASKKITTGIGAAAARREAFHLWFHPSNFSYDTETQFRIFESVLAYAASLRDAGILDIVTMRDYARAANDPS